MYLKCGQLFNFKINNAITNSKCPLEAVVILCAYAKQMDAI